MISNVTSVMDFWLCAEYLSPKSMDRPSADGGIANPKSDAEFPWRDPNFFIAAKKKPQSCYVAISFGVLSLDRFATDLAAVLGVVETNPSGEAAARGSAPTMSILTDHHGMVTGEVAFSSLPWAMGRLKRSGAKHAVDFSGFGGLDGFEAGLVGRLRDYLLRNQLVLPEGANPEKVTLRPIEMKDLRRLERTLFDECEWDPGAALETTVQVKAVYRPKDGGEEEEPPTDMLNSFIAADLIRVREAIVDNDVGHGLQEYLRGSLRSDRLDIRVRTDVPTRHTMPSTLPPGSWPTEFPLAYAQQFAVNQIIGSLSNGRGIFSVNGPPGTGKTTLLKDVVAAIVVQRAEAMAALSKPTDAFGDRAYVGTVGNFRHYFTSLDGRLGGFGVVVASSNNGAVENISKELPSREAISADIEFFSEIGDRLMAPKEAKTAKEIETGKSWGCFSAALGRADNIATFAERFLWGRMSDKAPAPKPLKDPPSGEEPPPPTLRTIVDRLGGSPGFKSWAVAKKEFLAAIAAVKQAIKEREAQAIAAQELWAAQAAISKLNIKLEVLAKPLSDARREEDEARCVHAAKLEEVRQASELLRLLETVSTETWKLANLYTNRPEGELSELKKQSDRLAIAQRAVAEAEQDVSDRRLLKPSWIMAIFFRKRRIWEIEFRTSLETLAKARTSVVEVEKDLREAKERHRRLAAWEKSIDAAKKSLTEAERALAALAKDPPLRSEVEDRLVSLRAEEKKLRDSLEAKEEAGKAFYLRNVNVRYELRDKKAMLDKATGTLARNGVSREQLERWHLWGMSEDDRQRATPWYDKALWGLRQNAFVAAMELHKAFIFEARKPLLANVSALIALMQKKLPRHEISATRLQQLWDCLYFFVPVVSTTFASLGRMFAGMERDSIGWLIIDEAGQATPQAAVGGIWRARRTVVVGDPLQLEPVVVLPEKTIAALSERFGLKTKEAPLWHPVTCSTQVLADRANPYGTDLDGQWIGAPLRVHRRCLDPMFSVANAIAYGGMMVYGTSPIRENWLGQSCWVHIPAQNATEHWIPAQGEAALRMVLDIHHRFGLMGDDDKLNVYVISPFKSVSSRMKELLRRRLVSDAAMDRRKTKGIVEKMVGTVHTFQGKEAPVVVLLLGGNPETPGAITTYAAKTPNLLNVAVTRAKAKLYVIGDHRRWASAQQFNVLAENFRSIGRDYVTEVEFFGKNESFENRNCFRPPGNEMQPPVRAMIDRDPV